MGVVGRRPSDQLPAWISFPLPLPNEKPYKASPLDPGSLGAHCSLFPTLPFQRSLPCSHDR